MTREHRPIRPYGLAILFSFGSRAVPQAPQPYPDQRSYSGDLVAAGVGPGWLRIADAIYAERRAKELATRQHVNCAALRVVRNNETGSEVT